MAQEQDLARALARLTLAWGKAESRSPQNVAELVNDCIGGGAPAFAQERAFAIGAELSQAAGRAAWQRARSAYAANVVAMRRSPHILKHQTALGVVLDQQLTAPQWNSVIRTYLGPKPVQANPLPMLRLDDAKRIAQEWFAPEVTTSAPAPAPAPAMPQSIGKRRLAAVEAHCKANGLTMPTHPNGDWHGLGIQQLADAEGVSRQAYEKSVKAALQSRF